MNADRIKKFFFVLALLVFPFKINAAYELRQYVFEIESSFAEQMLKEFDLRWEGDISVIGDKVEEIGMKFLARRRATIEEARSLELLVMDKFVEAVNEYEKIQPHLDIRPFSYKRISISISFEGINGFISDGSVTYVSNVSDLATTPSKNHIVYYSHDPFKDELIEELKEPYEEALRLASLSVDPLVHQGNNYDDEMDHLLESFKEEVYDDYGLDGWSIGGKWNNNVIEEIGAKFILKRFITQAEARQLMIEVAEKLLSALNGNEKIKPYLKQYPFPSSLLKLKFRVDGKYSESPDVSINTFLLEDNQITYNQEFLFPKEEDKMFRRSVIEALPPEPYNEALSIVKNDPQNVKKHIPSTYENLKNTFAATMKYVFFRFFSVFADL